MDEQFDTVPCGEPVSEVDETYGDQTSASGGDLVDDHFNEFKATIASCFPNTPQSIEKFGEINECREWIRQSPPERTTFVILSSNYAEQILPSLDSTWVSVKRIYIYGNYLFRDIDRVQEHRSRGIRIMAYDELGDLFLALLRDLSTYYTSKGKEQTTRIIPGVVSTSAYFEYSKRIQTKMHEFQIKDHQMRLRNIEKENDEAKQVQMESVRDNLKKTIKICNSDQDLESQALLFFVGHQTDPIQVEPSVTHSVSCATNEQLKRALPDLKSSLNFIIISREHPDEELLSFKSLLHYYYYPEQGTPIKSPSMSSQRQVTCIQSSERLIHFLYRDLGEHYRNRAMEVSRHPGEVEHAKYLLRKSSKCYELLKFAAQQALKRCTESQTRSKSKIV